MLANSDLCAVHVSAECAHRGSPHPSTDNQPPEVTLNHSDVN